MMKKFIFGLLSLGLLISLGCSEGDSAESGVGKLTIQLTDAPFPLDLIAEANVTIFKIEARHKGDSAGEDTNAMSDDETMEEEMGEMDGSSYIVLMEEEINVNLLDLTNGVTETLVDMEVPVGTYDQLRIYAKGINVVMNDEENTTYDLKLPSAEQSGIKVFIKPAIEIAGGLSTDLLLDFDVSRSFVPRGNIRKSEEFNGFNFKPVIKVSNLTTAGTLKGAVTTIEEESTIGLEGVQITIYQEGEVITSTFTDETGAYMVLGLDAGLYNIMAELEGYDSQTAEAIQIVSGNNTSLDFELVLSE